MRCLMNRLRNVQSLLSLCRNVCRGLYRAAWRVAKSKKTHTAVISTGLALVAAVLLYVPAVLSYLFFYYKYLPEQAMTIPMYLQYGYVLLPWGPGGLDARMDAPMLTTPATTAQKLRAQPLRHRLPRVA